MPGCVSRYPLRTNNNATPVRPIDSSHGKAEASDVSLSANEMCAKNTALAARQRSPVRDSMSPRETGTRGP